MDCRDKDALDKLMEENKGINSIIHFAASKAVGESVEKPLLYYRNNLVSLLNLLELMKKHEIKNIVFSSSCTVYGQPEVLPVTESAPLQKALSPYGNTKQICEEMIRDLCISNKNVNSINPTDKINSKLHFRTDSRSSILQSATFDKNGVSIDKYKNGNMSCLIEYIKTI
jgi:UDP-glucose 4-epimerase